jgi:hypothetical protein
MFNLADLVGRSNTVGADKLRIDRQIIGFNAVASVILGGICLYTVLRAKNLGFIKVLSLLLCVASVLNIPIAVATNWHYFGDPRATPYEPLDKETDMKIGYATLPLMCLATACGQIAHWIFSERYWQVSRLLKKFIKGGLDAKESIYDQRLSRVMNSVMISLIVINYAIETYTLIVWA